MCRLILVAVFSFAVSTTVIANPVSITHEYDIVKGPAPFSIDIRVNDGIVNGKIIPLRKFSDITLKRGVVKSDSNGNVIALEELTLQSENIELGDVASNLTILRKANISSISHTDTHILDVQTIHRTNSTNADDREPPLAGVTIYSDLNGALENQVTLLKIEFRPKSNRQQLVGTPEHLFNHPAPGEPLIGTVRITDLAANIFEEEIFIYPVEIKELSIRIPVRVEREE